MRHDYLMNVPVEEALKKLNDSLDAAGFSYEEETIRTRDALGRVTACAKYAKRCSPHYLASAMDGIALAAKRLEGASESTPAILAPHEFVQVDTGDVLPEGCDSVVMIEDVVEMEDGSVRLYSGIAPWTNVRQIGEDVSMGDMIVPSFTVITPSLIGALLAGGVNELEAVKKPVFAIIPTGDEIVSADAELKPGDIPEYNSAIFSAMLSEWGAVGKVYPVVRDDKELIKSAVSAAADECDGVLVLAGSSAGRDDYTSTVLSELGTMVIHGLAIKPGKPAVLGHIGKKPFFGLPGYPVSGMIVMEQIVKPVTERMTKRQSAPSETVEAAAAKRMTSSLKYQEYIRCRLSKNADGEYQAVPMKRGAGIVNDFTKAQGMIVIPQNSEGIEAGGKVTVSLIKDRRDVDAGLSVIGSHDPLIDEISDLLIRSGSRVHVSSSHVGSMGAIMAIRAGEALLGGIHLLDEASGEYNIPYLKKYFPDGGVVLVKGVVRKQGLMVAKGNPRGIRSVGDLVSDGSISYVNRQKGSGTRILLDYLIKRDNLDKDSIYGYTREEYTHTAVAAAIAAGSADAGLGIFSAAKTFDLDFIPIWDEEYDILVDAAAFEESRVQEFLGVLLSEEFAKRLEALGGYGCEGAGSVKFRY